MKCEHMERIENVNVAGFSPLISPACLKADQPITPVAEATVVAARAAIRAMLDGVDRRMLVVVGPCSIHDPTAAMEYARRLKLLRDELADSLFIVMRVYFEKPRTTVGWKGLIYDPRLDGSADIEEGLRTGRRLLLAINTIGVPTATEMLDPIVPQYIADLVSWGAIGARTTESQIHRQMASGLSMPIGFKNRTDGDIQAALDALAASRLPHSFLGIDSDGRSCIVKTVGNLHGHVVLRGGSRSGSNTDQDTLQQTVCKLVTAGLPPRIMIDCSHGNTGKRYEVQADVLAAAVSERVHGQSALFGVMLESNLHEGSQKVVTPAALKYGVSITDACLGWEVTAQVLRTAAHALAPVVGLRA